MSPQEFCTKYGIDCSEAETLEKVLRSNGLITTIDIAGHGVISKKVETRCLFAWRKHKAEEEALRRQEEALRKQREEEERFLREEDARIAKIARTIPITSTNGFEGYRITEYGGYVSGDEAIELVDGVWIGAGDFKKDIVNDMIKQIRATAIEELKVAAAQIGCNAVVGLDFDYVTVDRQQKGLYDSIINRTFIILTANGTAVTIEPL